MNTFFEYVNTIPHIYDVYWNNTVLDYATALVALIVLLAVFKVIQSSLIRHLAALSQKTQTDIDDTLIQIIKGIRPPFYTFVAFRVAILSLALPPLLSKALNIALFIWIAYEVILALQTLIDYVVRKKFFKDGAGEKEGIVGFLSGLLKGALWAVGILMILSNAGVNITSLVAGLGIGGLAVAFALQKIFGDLFSSLAIYLDKPYEVGDFIVVGDHSGTVEKIGIKTTRIKALQGEEIVIGNQEMTSVRVQNFKKLKERRISFSIGVTYETPQDKLKKIPRMIEEAINTIEHVRFDRSHLAFFGDSAIVFETVYYIKSDDYYLYMDARQEINHKIITAFQKEKIDFAYPTQTVYVQK